MTDWELLEISNKDAESEKKPKNYRVRILGIFYEDLLVPWFRIKGYECHDGKPSIYKDGKWLKKTYDYLLEKDGRYYIAEAKCCPVYNEGRWKKLNFGLLEKIANKKPKGAFQLFLRKDFLNKHEFRVNRVVVKPAGKILVWWDYDENDLPRIKEEYGLYEVFSIKEIITELKREPNKEYLEIIKKHREWADDLFKLLKE